MRSKLRNISKRTLLLIPRSFIIGGSLYSFCFSFTSCSQDPWTEKEKTDFMTDCQKENDDKNFCTCYMTAIMKAYPQAEDAVKLSFEEAVEYSKSCE